MEQNLENIKKQCPWVILLHESIPWNQVQDKAKIAALMTNECTSSGYSIGPANMKPYVVTQIHLIDCQDQEPVNIQSKQLENFIKEFYDLAFKEQQVKIVSIPNELLKEINDFVIIRGHQRKTGWNIEEILKILNYNLQIIKTDWTKTPLPPATQLSLELLYGIMISIFKQDFINQCPQIAILGVVLPLNFNAKISHSELSQNKNFLQNKVALLKEKLEKIGNWKSVLNFEATTSPDLLVAQFKDIIAKNLIGSSKRKKFTHLIYNLTQKYPIKQDRFDTRKMIKEMCYDIGKDYQLEPTWEQKFFAGLAYCLNCLPTDIQVFNNNTLRNPKLHFAYPYLLARCPALSEKQSFNSINFIKN